MNPTNDPNAQPNLLGTVANNAGPRYNRGILARLGGNPNNTLAGSLYGAWQQHKQNQMDQQLQGGMEHDPAGTNGAPGPDADAQPGWAGDAASPPDQVSGGQYASPGMEDQMPQQALSAGTADSPSEQFLGDALDLASDSFAGGKLVTSPTIARIGEAGPEAVIPLSSGPHDKTTGTSIMDQPIAVPKSLGGSARARYRHAVGPVATARTKPISADLPLKPNSAVR